MKILNFYRDNELRLGIYEDGRVIDVKKTAAKLGISAPNSTDEVIHTDTPSSLSALLENPVYVDDIRFAPAVLKPRKILCVGLNYKKHAEETDASIPEYPLLFSKFDNALSAHNDVIHLPKHEYKCDYEAELVIVIGKTAKDVKLEDAAEYIFGYTLGNDVSARELQYRSGQWLIGKSLDGFAPVGPFINTRTDVSDIILTSRVNGELRQNSSTADMIFNPFEIISYASSIMTLFPGDIIFSGTPAGVMMGYPPEKQVWLKPGDVVEISADSLGTLTNSFK